MTVPHDGVALRDRFRGALVGVVVGDCVGAPFEGSTATVPSDAIEDVAAGTALLRHTDDTVQTLALARSLLANGGRLEEDHLAMALARAWSREPDRGYGAGASALLARIHGGASWAEVAGAQFGGSGSWGNGAAMRTIPVALVSTDPANTADLARRQAAVSHTHAHAADGAALIAVAAHLALHGRWHPPAALDQLLAVATTPALRDALGRVAALPPTCASRDIARRLGNGVDAATSVPAALAVALRHPTDPMAALHTAVALGGDTDTIAAMATGIVAAATGSAALDPRLVERCEGHHDATHLADALADLHGT